MNGNSKRKPPPLDADMPWHPRIVLDLALEGKYSIVAMDDTTPMIEGAVRGGLVIGWDRQPAIVEDFAAICDDLGAKTATPNVHLHTKNLLALKDPQYAALDWEERRAFLRRFVNIIVEHDLPIGFTFMRDSEVSNLPFKVRSTRKLDGAEDLIDVKLAGDLLPYAPDGAPVALFTASGKISAGTIQRPFITGEHGSQPVLAGYTPPAIFTVKADRLAALQLADLVAWATTKYRAIQQRIIDHIDEPLPDGFLPAYHVELLLDIEPLLNQYIYPPEWAIGLAQAIREEAEHRGIS